jgi:hypothetical protein
METDVITFREGLYLATMGGAKALGIEVSQANLLSKYCRFYEEVVNAAFTITRIIIKI